MMFASKLAKLGKAPNINCHQVSVDPIKFNVYVCKQGVDLKVLNYKDEQYSLSKPINTYNYSEIIGINSNYILARNDEYFSLLKVKSGT